MSEILEIELSEKEEINLLMLYKKYDQAFPLVQEYLQKNPKDEIVQNYLHICIENQETSEESQDEINYIQLLVSLNHFEEAESLLVSYLKNYPNHHEAINLLNLCYEKKEQNIESFMFEEENDELLDINNEDYAKVLMMYGKYQEAFMVLEKEMKKNTNQNLQDLYNTCSTKIESFQKFKNHKKLKKYMINIVSRNNYGGILSFDALEVNRFTISISDINTEEGQKELEDFFNTRGYTKWAILSYIEIKG
jgi:tetratricopeptide (TPR) repeat protein